MFYQLIQSIPCLCWGLIGIGYLYFILRYLVHPIIDNIFENKKRKEQHKREKEWHELNKNADNSNELLTLHIKALEKKCTEFENTNELLKKQLKLYEELFKELNCEITPKSK